MACATRGRLGFIVEHATRFDLDLESHSSGLGVSSGGCFPQIRPFPHRPQQTVSPVVLLLGVPRRDPLRLTPPSPVPLRPLRRLA
ncbi:hypothetical protein OPV22_019045 [Ensete ventricosum]|uniref:Uncharacterized protein n=1 Tax=Ensete ventricosum TaxID=4639 RepID=A0AAV8QX93_ENSVE|nr:hypothetical protein OPV22_019045 [Ensete ventricosum]